MLINVYNSICAHNIRVDRMNLFVGKIIMKKIIIDLIITKYFQLIFDIFLFFRKNHITVHPNFA